MPTWSYARPLHWGYPQGIVPEHPAAQKHSYAYHEPSARAVSLVVLDREEAGRGRSGASRGIESARTRHE